MTLVYSCDMKLVQTIKVYIPISTGAQSYKSEFNVVYFYLFQSIERAHSVQSTASSVYEALSLKQERDRPQSTHSNRDDDRNSLKDLSISRR